MISHERRPKVGQRSHTYLGKRNILMETHNYRSAPLMRRRA